MKRRSRTKDLLLYVLISGTIIACILGVIELGVDRTTFMNGTGFAFFTLVLFGFFVEASRLWWKNPMFWALTGLLLVLHAAGFWELVRKTGMFKPAWSPILVLEYAIFLGCRKLIPIKVDHPS